ncbi:MAG: type IV secretion protein Rhs, partial [Bacteroidales bacterium]|nr:type IV secretion protein Rhs [Bacteroidales bacterium]
LAGRVTQLTRASGKTTQYAYDKASRIVEIKHNHKDGQRFEYNNAGQLVKAENKHAKVEFKRNKLGLIDTETVNDQSIQHSYNAIGQRTGLQSSLGANIQYEHDNFGNLANLTASQNETEWQADYKYDSLGFELERMLPGKVKQNFDYDSIGRLTTQQTINAKKQRHQRRYTWGINDRLQSINDSKHGETTFGYTPTGHLEHSILNDGDKQHRKADAVGNLFETNDCSDREYGYGGRLLKKGAWRYTYDSDGFLTSKYKTSGGFMASKSKHWKYQWNNDGMLETVTRPDGEKVYFTYDALGRRLSKTFKNTRTCWLWDGNVPLHEWKENVHSGEVLGNTTIDDNGAITWIFEENSFIPTAKLKGSKKYSILADHLGTPTAMCNDEGDAIWERSLDTFGHLVEGDHGACPFMYQGQYYDKEIELAYNRFRYYDPEDGRYISVDPIGLLSGEFGFYNYVGDTNGWTDVLGLSKKNSYSGLKPEPGYLRGKKHGIKQQDADAIRLARDTKTPIGRWGNKNDLDYAGQQAATLKPGEFADFPINSDHKCTVFYADGTQSVPDKIRVSNNGDGTFHGFPIDSKTAGPIVQ